MLDHSRRADDHDRLDAFNAKIAEAQERLTAVMATSSRDESERLATMWWAKMKNEPVAIPEDAPAELIEVARLFDARRAVFPKPLPPRPSTRMGPKCSRPTRAARTNVRGRARSSRRSASSSRAGPDGELSDEPPLARHVGHFVVRGVGREDGRRHPRGVLRRARLPPLRRAAADAQVALLPPLLGRDGREWLAARAAVAPARQPRAVRARPNGVRVHFGDGCGMSARAPPGHRARLDCEDARWRAHLS